MEIKEHIKIMESVKEFDEATKYEIYESLIREKNRVKELKDSHKKLMKELFDRNIITNDPELTIPGSPIEFKDSASK